MKSNIEILFIGGPMDGCRKIVSNSTLLVKTYKKVRELIFSPDHPNAITPEIETTMYFKIPLCGKTESHEIMVTTEFLRDPTSVLKLLLDNYRPNARQNEFDYKY